MASKRVLDAIRCGVRVKLEDGAQMRSRFASTLLISALRSFLESNLDCQISLEDVAYLLGREKSNCSKFFRHSTGTSFSNWERRIRIRKAKTLLRTEQAVSSVAVAVGYRDITTFERNFRRSEGVSPTAFRRLQSRVPAGAEQPH